MLKKIKKNDIIKQDGSIQSKDHSTAINFWMHLPWIDWKLKNRMNVVDNKISLKEKKTIRVGFEQEIAKTEAKMVMQASTQISEWK